MNKLKYTLLLIFTIVSGVLFSQSSTNSPYSRFGLGNLNGSISSQQSALGGNSVVFHDENSINTNNPATFSALKPKSFLLSTAFTSKVTSFSTSSLSQNESSTSFSHMAIAFPVNKYLFVSSGLLPFSNVGYQIDYSETEDWLEDTISISSSGNGGISKYYFGTSVKLHKSLSLGANLNYHFGGLSRIRTADFNNSTIFNVNSVDRTNVTGVSFETGLLFNTEFSDNKKFSFGLTYQGNTTLNAKRTLLGTTFEYLSSSLIVKDTFQYSTDEGELVLPSKLSTGLMYSSDKILFVTNYASQNWSDYQLSFGNEIEEDYLDNSSSISAGLQITPDFNSVTKYWKRVNYRIGGRYDKTYLNINENQLTEKSVTFGLGLPVRRSNTFYNIALELGESGTTDDNLIKEQFARFTFGVTFKGIWFVKRKYD